MSNNGMFLIHLYSQVSSFCCRCIVLARSNNMTFHMTNLFFHTLTSANNRWIFIYKGKEEGAKNRLLGKPEKLVKIASKLFVYKYLIKDLLCISLHWFSYLSWKEVQKEMQSFQYFAKLSETENLLSFFHKLHLPR